MDYASVAWRAWASILDVIVLFIISYAVASVFGMASATGFEILRGPAFLAFFIWFAYYVASEARFGATIGKALVGLRVVDTQGCPISLSQAVIRNLLRIVDGLFFYLIGAIFAWSTPTHQRLGDRVAGTVVVRGAIEPSRLEVCHVPA
jgi:uncharacterized RDD family membrane protein YckC